MAFAKACAGGEECEVAFAKACAGGEECEVAFAKACAGGEECEVAFARACVVREASGVRSKWCALAARACVVRVASAVRVAAQGRTCVCGNAVARRDQGGVKYRAWTGADPRDLRIELPEQPPCL